MAKLVSAGHPEDFIRYAPFAKTPAELVGFKLYVLVTGFKVDEEKQSQAEKLITCTAEVAGFFYDNGDGDEEDWVAWEEVHKDCREKERERQLSKHRFARKIATGRKGKSLYRHV